MKQFPLGCCSHAMNKEWSQCTEWSAHGGICFISDWMLFDCQFRAFRLQYAYIAEAQMTLIFDFIAITMERNIWNRHEKRKI